MSEITARWDPFGDRPLLGAQLAAARADEAFTSRLATRASEDQALLRRISKGSTMDKVRAKVYVTEIGQTISSGKVKLSAVCRGTDNKEWAAATPWGNIELGINNKLAAEFFEVGQEYFVDFTLAPKGQEGMGDRPA